jgi:hypothetical protein
MGSALSLPHDRLGAVAIYLQVTIQSYDSKYLYIYSEYMGRRKSKGPQIRTVPVWNGIISRDSS